MAETILYDSIGNPINFSRRPGTGRAGAVPLDRRPVTVAGEFSNPEAIKSAWASACRGDIKAIMRLADEIEHDLKIAGLLRQRRLAVAKLPWKVLPADEEDATAKTIAEAVTAMLQGLKLRSAIGHLQDATVKPLAVLEIVWQNRGTTTDVAALVPRLGTEFTFDFAETGEQLRLITDPAQPKGLPIEPNKFVVRNSTELGVRVISRGGLVKGLAARWLIKTHLLTTFLKFCDVYGMPWRVGKYDPNVNNDEQIAILKRAVAALGVDAGAVIPSDMEIEIIESAKNSGRDVFSLFLEINDREIAIGILGQTLTSAGSDLGKGTLSLGEVHDEVRHELVEADAVAIAECLSEQLIIPYVVFNFGEQENYPRLEIIADPEEDLQARLTMDQTLVNIGVPLTVEYFQRTYDRPAPADGETVIERQQSPVNPYAFASERTPPFNSPHEVGGNRSPFGHPLQRRGN